MLEQRGGSHRAALSNMLLSGVVNMFTTQRK